MDNTTSQNNTKELTREEARMKRKQLLDQQRKQAEKADDNADLDDNQESVATFILPGD